MEFVIWFGVVLAALTMSGENLFPVIVLAAAGQFLFALAAVFAGRSRCARYRD